VISQTCFAIPAHAVSTAPDGLRAQAASEPHWPRVQRARLLAHSWARRSPSPSAPILDRRALDGRDPACRPGIDQECPMQLDSTLGRIVFQPESNGDYTLW